MDLNEKIRDEFKGGNFELADAAGFATSIMMRKADRKIRGDVREGDTVNFIDRSAVLEFLLTKEMVEAIVERMENFLKNHTGAPSDVLALYIREKEEED